MPRRLVLAALVLVAVAPARADAASIIAAYDRYEPGQGFQIGLVNATTGATIAVPAGVNTAADELHPAVSSNGRFIWFARVQLAPGLSGDVLPPSAREFWRADRISGEIVPVFDPPSTGVGFGATFANFGAPVLTWGFRPGQQGQNQFAWAGFRRVDGSTGAFTGTGVANALAPNYVATGDFRETTHALTDLTASTPRHYLAASAFNGNGVRGESSMRVQQADTGVTITQGNHPTPRPGDRHIAFQHGFGTAADIKSFNFPTVPAQTAAAPISTANTYEGMPAWSTDDSGKHLGFVRVAGGRRQLIVFDTTPGIQDALNPPIDIGPEAPTAGLRVFQETFGGLAFGAILVTPVPTFTVCSTCVDAQTSTIKLTPRLTSASTVGIFIARIKGTRSLLGRKVPKITPIGRVPLGQAKKGRTTFKWDGRVDGKKLKPGSYLLTFRALDGERITATSRSVRFKVDRKGNLQT